jgi:hypothetical protein
VEDTAGRRDGRLRRGMSWTQMAELAETRGDAELAAEFRRIAECEGDRPAGRERAVPPPRETRG